MTSPKIITRLQHAAESKQQRFNEFQNAAKCTKQ